MAVQALILHHYMFLKRSNSRMCEAWLCVSEIMFDLAYAGFAFGTLSF